MLKSVERWGIFEVSISGPDGGNPFVDYIVSGHFSNEHESVEVSGFYDGNGIYKIRFMPSYEGIYSYETSGNFDGAETKGEFTVLPAKGNNHGPVRVHGKYHFAYEDGTKYYPFGTTCYVWTHQPENIRRQTLETLSKGYFNKIRFCVFPKHYIHNFKDPVTFPYEGTPVDNSELNVDNMYNYSDCHGNSWDFSRFNPAHFQLMEENIAALRDMGIEADIILFHPYDRWGFSQMGRDDCLRYLKYVISRFSAYRNIWWSMANEYDLVKSFTADDWECYANYVYTEDKYNHLRSIHNCVPFYDYTKPWVTHCCMQRQDKYRTTELTEEYRKKYGKPIVWDEIVYEGNIDISWGNISGRLLVRRFWEAVMRGGYAGHGETYEHPDDILWWSHGGVLHGESQERIKFLRTILDDVPGYGLMPADGWYDASVGIPESYPDSGYEIHYFGFDRPSFRIFNKEEDKKYHVDIIDTWEMTVTDAGIHSGRFKISLPGKEYMAVRLKRVE